MRANIEKAEMISADLRPRWSNAINIDAFLCSFSASLLVRNGMRHGYSV